MSVHKLSILIPLALLVAPSCYREVIQEVPEPDRFDLFISPDLQEYIYNSRDTSYTVEDPQLQLTFNDQPLDLKEIRVRGKSALDYRRKSYAVFLRDPLPVVDRYNTSVKYLKRFKLVAMAMDYTYIEHRVSFGILQEAGVMPLFFKFVEFRINGETQGVYLLVEDPEQYYKEHESEFILRRDFDHHIADMDYTPSLYQIPQAAYEQRYQELYSNLTQLQGEELYRTLDERLDMESYFRKIGIDYLLHNGDYTDEIYLYAMVEKGAIRFHPIPWDYDDVFASQPHEIGRAWGMGTLFGTRYYPNMDAVYSEIGQKLIYSIEDDLDYSIARDPYLYGKYMETFSGLLEVVDQELIERVFRETQQELTPFYQVPAMIEQSQYDRKSTTLELWQTNLEDKQKELIDRINYVKEWISSDQ
jgi:spore coat protein H